jgi:hypothetical protein
MSPEFLYYPDLAAGKRGLSWEEARLLRKGPVRLECEICPVVGCRNRGSLCCRDEEDVRAGLDEAEKRVRYARDVLARSIEEHARYLELKAIEKDAKGEPQ